MTSKQVKEKLQFKSGFFRFSEIFGNHAKKIFEEVKQNQEMLEQLGDNLLGYNKKPISRPMTPKNVFFGKLYSGFHEISESYFSLLDIEIYIGRFPYGNTSIKRTRHLLYHIESYLNEVYIFTERLRSYLTTIGRSYRNDPKHQEILNKTRPLFSLIKASFNHITLVRGQHVHKYRVSDEDIERLSTFELLLHSDDKDLLASINYLFSIEYPQVRKKWKQQISKNNKELKTLLDYCFDVLFQIVADENFDIRYPSNL